MLFWARHYLLWPVQSLLYALNIGTLAIWVSVAAAGGMGRWIGALGHPPKVEPLVVPAHESVGIEWLEESSEAGAAEPGGAGPTPATADPAEDAPALPAPPQMSLLTELPPLPEVPEVPEIMAPEPAVATTLTSEPAQPATATPPSATATAPSATPARPQPGAVGRSGTAGRTGGSVGRGGSGSSMSIAARLAAGRMPPPNYPFESRSRGQTGTVIVEFTIGSDGRVSTAQLFSPCRWPALNAEALRAVKTWQFPPGEVMTFKKPIVFTLQDR